MTKDVEHHTNTAADFLINLHPIIPAVAVSIVDWLIVTVVAIALLYLPMKLKRYIMRYFYAITAGMSLITSTIGMLAEGIERASEKGTWSQRIPWVPVVIGVVVGIPGTYEEEGNQFFGDFGILRPFWQLDRRDIAESSP